ncbi:bifunctional acetate--CoA ligase family protein/GNAT family N-acetyltransferase [Pseudoduganella namucuonensis]|uniref:Acetyltransferase n=1 Tax=Pseudoduganella namucuonensis TaxID=1035707 RepID=A0A1I7LFS1_9BURK|nr:GNAT family N-acetyltransferase [Pseudoduganella namucuonensis]SFV08508.1 acetyltransferase [Pseudoduganella namucuonensis]
MSIRNFGKLFDPGSVAVIGASQAAGRIGTIVLNNMAGGGYAGALWPVNPKYEELLGVRCYPDVAALPAPPDLAVICTPPATVPDLVAALGERGTRAAVVLTPGLAATRVGGGGSAHQAMLDAARPHLLRILGPGGVGLLSPANGLNASVAQGGAKAGRIAFVSQSDALMTASLDWARLHGVGYSKCVSLGERGDIDLGDLLDFLADDEDTRAILLYMESAVCARKFMTAGRLAARAKPVIVLKAGRDASDEVYDAAFRRAGMLRVHATEDLFDAAETLARLRPTGGERLAIMGNGGALGRIATDALDAADGKLARFGAETLLKLGLGPRPDGGGANAASAQAGARIGGPDAAAAADVGAEGGPPGDTLGHALSEALGEAMRLAEGLLPAAWRSHPPPAVQDAPPRPAPAFALDLGGGASAATHAAALEALLADAEVDAVLLLHAPASGVDTTGIAETLAPLASASGKNVLSCWLGGAAVADARRVFADAGLPTYDTPEQAVRGFMQMVQYRRNQEQLMQVPGQSPATGKPERAAVRAMVDQALAAGRARLEGGDARAVLAAYGIPVAGEGEAAAARLARAQAHELVIEVRNDPMFGPVIRFGQGGLAGKLADDHAVGLPPLNMVLAAELVERTRVARVLGGHRHRPAADIQAVCHALIQVSDLVADIAELEALSLDPLLADAHGLLALDARIVLGPPRASHAQAIRPYPQELEQEVEWQGAPLLLRPIKPEDAPQHVEFFAQLHPDDVRLRFFSAMRELQPAQLARLTQIDYDRAMAFIATRVSGTGRPETLGVVRAVADPDNRRAEFAILVRSDLKGKGLGAILFDKLIDYFRGRGTAEMVGTALSENGGVQQLVRRFGGTVSASPEPGLADLIITLQHQH